MSTAPTISRLALTIALTLLLVFFFPFSHSAEDIFLYHQITLYEPADIELQEILDGKRFYVYPEELTPKGVTLKYFLEPRRVIVYVPGFPSMVLEIYAEVGLDELVRRRIDEIRKLKAELNRVQNQLEQINNELSEGKDKLSASLNRLARGNADSTGDSPASEPGGFDPAQQEISHAGSLLLSIRDNLLKRTIQEVSKAEVAERYELERLELSLLLNASAEVFKKPARILSINSPNELIDKSLGRLSRTREESIGRLSRLSREVSLLNQRVPVILKEAFGFTADPDTVSFLSTLARGKVDLKGRPLSSQKFIEFSRLYLELLEKTEEQKQLSSLVFLLANMDRRIRSAVAKGVTPRLLHITGADFAPPASASGVNLNLYESAKNWTTEDFKAFVLSLSKSVAGKGAHLVRIPAENDLRLPRTVNLSRKEYSALLSALSGRDVGKPEIIRELRTFALEQAKALRGSSQDSASEASYQFYSFCARILGDLLSPEFARPLR